MATNTLECTLCNKPRVERLVDPIAHGAKPVWVALCQTCDRRKCKEGHYIQDPFAKKCPTCGEIL